MCGIVGYIGDRPVVDTLVAGLKKLEYRGYDSSGIAVTNEHGSVSTVKEAGKLVNLIAQLPNLPTTCKSGIGHTRWATHGRPDRGNAHPHTAEGITLVHNGIIENFDDLKNVLLEEGFEFNSETDSEVVAKLLSSYLRSGVEPDVAIKMALDKLDGAYALGVIFHSRPENLYVAKKGSPLAIGKGNGEIFFGSDISSFGEFCQSAYFLKDNEWARLSVEGISLFKSSGEAAPLDLKEISWEPGIVDKGEFPHFMLKEIHEQPDVIRRAIQGYTSDNSLDLKKLGIERLEVSKLEQIHIVACGTAYIAGLVCRSFIERTLQIPVNVEIASEFRYREPFLLGDRKTLVIVISQSGETADTLASLKYAAGHECQTLSICNVPFSSIVRHSQSSILMTAGPEIGVASTKAFIGQILCLYLWSLAAGKEKGFTSIVEIDEALAELKQLPNQVAKVLETKSDIEKIAAKYNGYKSFLFVGRGSSYPIAIEGALKLKEISYIHAEAYAAGELKHGPIALVDKDMPVLAIAPNDRYQEKTVSNILEIRARNGIIIGLGDSENKHLASVCDDLMSGPSSSNEVFQALLSTIPLQLFSYYVACQRGEDVDQPRNLAKSVTVE
ncbi:glutamine--fructose-6-phosphate transaminase (isomerizing) [Pseudobacteriovorax antillogorgiicola]|uniref:Glutamine--fructose-6-phosphate aminotransferase [isomerizing] n=1 Tax=Pseudobacteriovorax antillogorgiicola TaxID=1513793 RepID=A0A1Y6C6F6_9BACT|nr:glutamine--fructose-6-phosphate transaminase (isomerizing) [Pseudobacteriovorax antillogorgiicola]TCS50628.1 glutamine--fructose-6-phosphate transaminase [Pseudobacteriovorax antillogorgiicola]SMF39444.1 glutamine--fructose-6-phosphate transaminase [Pseudobacteriovorax antillogorgiicola]